MSIQDQKTLLAKLMATENITVEHRNAKTASFNLKTRTLVCPTWKEMDGDIYDLLMGHEISHALHTPPGGWHDAIIEHDKPKSFKSFLNVVEDARIERLLKIKYPGIKRPMVNGYKTLIKRGFFGSMAMEELNDLYLIDRLNIAAKGGSSLNIKFHGVEEQFYNRLMNLETWEAGVALAEELFEYSKKEQKEGEARKKDEIAKKLKELSDSGLSDENEDDEDDKSDKFDDLYEFDDDESGDSEDTDGEAGDKNNEGDEDGESESGKDEDGEGDEDKDEDGSRGDDGDKDSESGEDTESDEKNNPTSGDENGKSDGAKEKLNNDKNKNVNGNRGNNEQEEFSPKSFTDETFRKKEEELLEKNTEDVVHEYVKIPTPNLKKAIVPYDTVNKLIQKHMLSSDQQRIDGLQLYHEFKDKNSNYIMCLVKEFEMRKAATQYKKLKISDSGDIDENKISQYKLTDDIFRKLMKVSKGKSHGLVLILDKSGSMAPHMKGAMEQIIILAMFCRKVNIPFIAFSFTSRTSTIDKDQFSTNPGELVMNAINFREMFNSKMGQSTFISSVVSQLRLTHRYNVQSDSVPEDERMGSTPLDEALVITRDVLLKFKEAYNLNIISTIIVHDGNSDSRWSKYVMMESSQYKTTSSLNYPNIRPHLVDKNTRASFKVNKDMGRRGITISLMEWIKQTTGSRIYGFYILNNSKNEFRYAIMEYYRNKDGIKTIHNGVPDYQINIAIGELKKRFIEEGFIESYTSGYERFYLIPGSNELVADGGIITEQNKKWTAHRLYSAFMKSQKKQKVSRVLVNRFIGQIATEL